MSDSDQWVVVVPVAGEAVPQGCEYRIRMETDGPWTAWERETDTVFCGIEVRWYNAGEYEARMPAPPKPALTMPMPQDQWEALSRKEQAALSRPLEDAWEEGADIEAFDPVSGEWYPFGTPYQLRLKPTPEPPKPLTVWVNVYSNWFGSAHSTKKAAESVAASPFSPYRTVKFVEVIEDSLDKVHHRCVPCALLSVPYFGDE